MRLPTLTIFILMFSSTTAFANWGTGYYNGVNCNQPIQPAPAASNASDELSNIRGNINRDRRLLREKENALQGFNDRISTAKRKMTRVISAEGMAAIEEHHTHRRPRSGYQFYDKPTCDPAGRGDGNATPIPQGFCHHNPTAREGYPAGHINLWDSVVANDEVGKVNQNICNFHVPPRDSAPSQGDKSACLQGLGDFYEVMDERQRANEEIARLRRSIENYEARIGRINTEVSEGRYCANCYSERRGYAANSTGDQLVNVIGPVMMIGAALLARNQQRQQPPHVLPYGAQPMPYRGFQQRPYVAQIPGYYNVHNGVYGGAPGSTGVGSFGCQNTSPGFSDNPFLGNQISPVFGNSPGVFNNPFAQPFINPNYQNGIFNPGFPPGGAPVMLPGMRPGQQMQLGFPPALQWANRGPLTQAPNRFGLMPGMMPGMGPAILPGMNQGFPGMFGPGQFGLGGQFGAPGFGGQFGQNQFFNAPATLPYLGGGAYSSVSNVPGLGYNYPGTYSYQMGQIAQRIQQLGSGTYYTPPVLPYPTYSTTPVNTVPVGGGGAVIVPAPAPVPVPTPTPTGPGIVPPTKKK